MNAELKNVNFLGDRLIAARGDDSNIYAGVRRMCYGIGFTANQATYQVALLKRDQSLLESTERFSGSIPGALSKTLFLRVDSVPSWLNSISLEPLENKSALVERLGLYRSNSSILRDAMLAAFNSTKPTIPPRAESAAEVGQVCTGLQIFEHEQFGNIRTITEPDGKVLFCATDIAKALDYSNPHDALARHCRYLVKHEVPHPQSPDKLIKMGFIPEGDVYRLIIGSKLPGAEKFEHWLFDEVVPSIIKTGMYIQPSAATVNVPSVADEELRSFMDETRAFMSRVAEFMERVDAKPRTSTAEQTSRAEPQYTGMGPAGVCSQLMMRDDFVRRDASVWSATSVAREYGMSAYELNNLLCQMGIQYKKDGVWHLDERFEGHGYTTIRNTNGYDWMGWTAAGRFFLYWNLQKCGYLPIDPNSRMNVISPVAT